MQLRCLPFDGPTAAAREALDAHGAVVVQDVPVADDAVLLRLCSAFGVPTREGNGPPPGTLVRDLVWRPADGDQEPLALHTDSVFTEEPNRLMALACGSSAENGHGASLVVHAEDVIGLLDAGDADLLRSRPVHFVKERGGAVQQSWRAPVLGSDRGRPTIRFHRWHARTEDAELEGALTRLVRILDDEIEPAYRPLRAGEVLFLDNRRVMHGRTAVSGRVERMLRRVKMTAL